MTMTTTIQQFFIQNRQAKDLNLYHMAQNEQQS